ICPLLVRPLYRGRIPGFPWGNPRVSVFPIGFQRAAGGLGTNAAICRRSVAETADVHTVVVSSTAYRAVQRRDLCELATRGPRRRAGRRLLRSEPAHRGERRPDRPPLLLEHRHLRHVGRGPGLPSGVIHPEGRTALRRERAPP